MIEKFMKMDNSKKIPIVICIAIVFIVAIILYVFNRNGNSDYEKLKEDSKQDFVYTINSKEKNNFFVYVPYINIKGIKSINDDIDSYMLSFINEDMVRSAYEYEINGKVLSLVIKTVNYDVDDVPEVYFKTYNLNLDTLELINDGDLLVNYELTIDDVSNSIEKQFKYWYKDILKEKYFDEEECDYECFLENRDVDDYSDNVSYYIEKGKLVVFKPFVFYSIMGEEKYFKEEDFKFIISK